MAYEEARMVRDVVIFDTTLRDGEQAPGNTMTPDEKRQLARQLDTLGVDVIEAGFPAASEGDYRAVQDVAAGVRRAVIAALARCVDRDIDLAGEALRSAARGRIHVFVSTSDIHLTHKLKIGRDDCVAMARAAVRRARGFTDDVEFSAEDASRTDLDFLCRVVEGAIAEGATTINLPDTVGYAMPTEYANMFRTVRERVPGADRVTFSCHCHDDLGLAVANSLAAIDAGVGQVECTINGIGERAGNAALEEIVMASRVRPQVLNFRCNVDPREIYRTSRLLSHLTGVFPQRNKAIVGRNAFAHEAGIHQHGVMQNGLTYEIMQPETVGVPGSTLVLGKHSGRHALERRYHELGYDLAEGSLERVYHKFVALADKKREILDEDLLTLLHDGFHDAPELFQITQLYVVCGTAGASATVHMAGPWPGERRSAASGDGPIAATFAAVSEIVGEPIEVANLSIQSVTPGRDSLGQVSLQARVNGKSLSGHGASTDIVDASARALVNALNKAHYADRLESDALNSVYLWGV
jgi:2-isopropylmalate synthase